MTTIKLRRGNAASWTSANPLLADGEMGVELDTARLKFGDGVTSWNLLEYHFPTSDVQDLIDAALGDLPPGGVYAQADVPVVEGTIVWLDTDSVVSPSGGVGYTRASASKTTVSLAAGASETGTITLANAYRLYSITTSAPARVRLYTTSAKQSADASRAIGTDPTGDHGLILEFVSTASLLTADLSPLVDGFDAKATPDGAIPITITNTGAGAAAVTVTLIWIRSE